MSASFNFCIRRRSGRWRDSFAVTDRSLLRIEGASETGMLHGRGGAARGGGVMDHGRNRSPASRLNCMAAGDG
jgi:hypothetical protein